MSHNLSNQVTRQVGVRFWIHTQEIQSLCDHKTQATYIKIFKLLIIHCHKTTAILKLYSSI